MLQLNSRMAVVDTSTQETQPTQEEAEETEAKVEYPHHEKEGDNKEEAKENQEEKAPKFESKPTAEEGDNEEKAKNDQQEEAPKVESKPTAEEGNNEEEDAKEDQDEEIEEAKPDFATQKEKAKGDSSSQLPLLRRGKRKRGSHTEAEKKLTPRAKRAKATKAQEDEPGYFMEKRNLEDLWRAAFPVGTEWDQLESLYEFN